MLSISQPKIGKGNYPDIHDVVFEATLTNYENRIAEIVCSYFELWLGPDLSSGGGTFLSILSPDLRNPEKHPRALKAQQSQPLRLIWHSQPEQLQLIEDYRKGKDALLQIRVQFSLISSYPDIRSGFQPPRGSWESAISDSGTQHIAFAIPATEWIDVLATVGFRHVILREFPSQLPERMGVPAGHLDRAWAEHRSGRPEAALSQCYLALECLGFNLYDGEIGRAELVRRILNAAPEKKQQEFTSLLSAVTDFLHLARHERGAPVPLDYVDSELAVMMTSAVLEHIASRIGKRSGR